MKRTLPIFLVLLSLGAIVQVQHARVLGQPSPATPNVGIWNDNCVSANMTLANPLCTALGNAACGCNYLSPGTQLTIDINVTNAPLFNAYQFSVYYDPTNLTLSSYNVGQANVPGESPMFNSPFIANTNGVFDNLTTPGAIRAEVVNLNSASGNGTVYGSGVLAYLTFNIKGYGVSPFVMAAGTCCPAEGGGATADDWTRLVLGSKFIDVTTSDGYLQNNPELKLGPVAKFTWSPSKPFKGESIVFNATGSYDADVYPHNNANVTGYVWSFGDGAVLGPTTSPTTSYTFKSTGLSFEGNFSVRLTVFDKDGFIGMVAQRVEIFPPPSHQLTVSMQIDHSSVPEQSPVNITLTVTVNNPGTFDETYNLTIIYGPPNILLKTFHDRVVLHGFTHHEDQVTTVLNTKGLAVGTYEIDGVVTDPYTTPTNSTAKTTFRITASQSSPLLYTVGSIAGVGVALALLGVVLRRRGRPLEEE